MGKIKKIKVENIVRSPITASIGFGLLAIIIIGGSIIGIQYLTGNPPEFIENIVEDIKVEEAQKLEGNLVLGAQSQGSSWLYPWKNVKISHEIEIISHDKEAKQIEAIVRFELYNEGYENKKEDYQAIYKGFKYSWDLSGNLRFEINRYPTWIKYGTIHLSINNMEFYEKVYPTEYKSGTVAKSDDAITRIEIPVVLEYIEGD